jgi:hypothetical protein
VGVGAYIAKPRIESEIVQDVANDGRGLKLPVGVQREAARAGVEHHAPTWEAFVFVPGDDRRQAATGQACGAEPAPAFPNLVVPARVGEALAIRFGVGERRAVDDEP